MDRICEPSAKYFISRILFNVIALTPAYGRNDSLILKLILWLINSRILIFKKRRYVIFNSAGVIYYLNFTHKETEAQKQIICPNCTADKGQRARIHILTFSRRNNRQHNIRYRARCSRL